MISQFPSLSQASPLEPTRIPLDQRQQEQAQAERKNPELNGFRV
jgi:hypothetical protein